MRRILRNFSTWIVCIARRHLEKWPRKFFSLSSLPPFLRICICSTAVLFNLSSMYHGCNISFRYKSFFYCCHVFFLFFVIVIVLLFSCLLLARLGRFAGVTGGSFASSFDRFFNFDGPAWSLSKNGDVCMCIVKNE